MKTFLPVTVVLALAGSLPVSAQVIPATPKKFDTSRIGEAASGGSSTNVAPLRPQTTVRTTTHIVLGEPRQWKMSDGKFFVGKLIAFEDIVMAGNAGTTPPVVPNKPTVVRDGKVRLFVEGKSYEVPLERLGEEERKFIENTRAAIAAKK